MWNGSGLPILALSPGSTQVGTGSVPRFVYRCARCGASKNVIKLWHDDVRPAPKGWAWARTNAEAQFILRGGKVSECSLDHDLGFSHVDIPDDPDELMEVMQLKGDEETGLELVRWMVENDLVPPSVRIHSWNPPGARAMAQELALAGYTATIAPFQP